MLRSDLYKAIRDIIKTGVPGVKMVDLQKQQFKKIPQNTPVPLPAILIEFQRANFTELARNSQMGNLTVSIYYYLDLVTESFWGAKSEDQSIALLDSQDALYRALNGQSRELFSKLIRTNEEPPEYGERYIMFRTDFTTNVKEILEPVLATTPRPIVKLQMI